MADSVDDRIVAMKFDNDDFEKRISATLGSLDKLQKSLDFTAANRNLAGLNTAADQVDFSGMASNIETISSRFSAMGAAGFAVIERLTNSVLDFVQNTAGKVIDPIFSGGKERSLNIEQAKFQFKGLGIDVQKGMDSALASVKDTAFGLGEAAKIAAQFGASGIKAGDQMTSALRGVAGAAAMTGSSFSEIGDIFAGSAGAGKVTNQDLLQFATRGLNAAAAVAPIIGKTEAQVHEMAAAGTLDFETFASAMDKAFGAHAKDANQTYTGSLSNMHAALSRLGAAIETPHLEQQRILFNAITPVIDKITKAIGPLIDAFSAVNKVLITFLVDILGKLDFSKLFYGAASFAKDLASSFEQLFGTIVMLFNGVKMAFEGLFPGNALSIVSFITIMFAKLAEAVNSLVQKELPAFVYIVAAVFSTLKLGIVIIKNVASLFIDLFKALIPQHSGTTTIGFFGNLARVLLELNTFLISEGVTGFFSLLRKILIPVATVLGIVIGKIFDFFTTLKYSAFLGAVGDALVTVGKAFVTIFDAIKNSSGLQAVADMFGTIKDAIGSFITSFDPSNAFGSIKGLFVDLKNAVEDFFSSFHHGSDDVDQVTGKVQNLHEKTIAFVKTIGASDLGGDSSPWQKIADSAEKSSGFFGTILNDVAGFIGFLESVPKKIGDIIGHIGNALSALIPTLSLKNSNKAVDVQDILQVFNLLLSTGLILTIQQFLTPLADISKDFKAILGSIKSVFGGLTNTLKAMQQQIKAKALVSIATAVILLIGALFVLQTMDIDKIGIGLAVIAAGFLQLALVMKALDKIGGEGSGKTSGLKAALRLQILSDTLVTMATSMLILSTAIAVLGHLKPDELERGFAAITGGILLFVSAVKFMGDDAAKMAGVGLAMMGIATAMVILSAAVLAFGLIPEKKLMQGISGVAVSLGLIVAVTQSVRPEEMLAAGSAMIPLAIGVTILAGAVAIFGNMKFGDMIKGIIGVGFALGIIVGAMHAMPEAGILAEDAAAIVIVAVGLRVMAEAVSKMGSMSMVDLSQGLEALVVIMATMVISLNLMKKALPGAQALIVTAAAMLIFSEVIKRIGELPLWTIIKGLGGMIAIIVALTVVAIALDASGAILALESLAIAMFTLGAGFALFGVGASLLIASLMYLVKSWQEHSKELIQYAKEMLAAIPQVIVAFVEALAIAAKALVPAAKTISDSVATILINALEALVTVIPHIVEVIYTIFDSIMSAIIKFFSNRGADFIQLGFNLILALATGILNNIGQLTILAVKIITAFATTLAANAPKLVVAVVTLIVAFLSAIDANIDFIVAAGLHILVKLLEGIYTSMSIISDAVTAIVVLFITSIANLYQTVIDTGAALLVRLIKGITRDIDNLIEAGGNLILHLIIGLGSKMQQIVEVGGNLIIYLMYGFEHKLIEVVAAAGEMVITFMNSLADWINQNAQRIHDAGVNLAGAIVNGLVVGLLGNDNKQKIIEGVKAITSLLPEWAQKLLGINSPSKVFMEIGGYVGAGLALGLDNDKLAQNAAVQHAERVVKAFSETLSKMPDGLPGVDTNPTITPVLDLTKVAAGARGLNDLMTVSDIAPNVSLNQARLIASTTPDQQAPPTDNQNGSGPTHVTFEQNNYSPKALSTNDIYRNQKSQFALAKEELGI